MNLLLLISCAATLSAQQVLLGTSADPCTGGSTVIPAANAAPGVAFRWGKQFSCTIPAAGSGVLTVITKEPLAVPASQGVTGPNQRVFTVAVNGAVQETLDLWAMCGLGKDCQRTYHVTASGSLKVDFAASARNAIVYALKWEPDAIIWKPSPLPTWPSVQLNGAVRAPSFTTTGNQGGVFLSGPCPLTTESDGVKYDFVICGDADGLKILRKDGSIRTLVER